MRGIGNIWLGLAFSGGKRLADRHPFNIPSPDDRRAAAAGWSPRTRLFFLVGVTTAAWGVVVLLIANWV